MDRLASNRSSVEKEGKKEAAINRSIRKANYGDLLWVQLHGSSWWPAQVIDESTISAIHKPRERKKGEVLVRLYGSYIYLFVDPIKSHLEFEKTLNKYCGSHNVILKESLKQDLHQLKLGRSKKKEMKKKEKAVVDAPQERMVKQKKNVISKTGNKKFPSCRSSRALDANSPAKRSKATSLGSVRTEDNKRKKEEAQKKYKSNRTKSLGTSLGKASGGATHKASLKRASLLSDKSEEGNIKKQKHNDNQKNVKPNCPNSKLSRSQGSAYRGHSLSEKMGSPRTEVQTQNKAQKKLGKSPTTSEETPKEPSARKLKVMRLLGLVGPAGSPFGSISNSN